MKALRLTDSARRDLAGFWAYLARENSASVADQQIERVFAAFESLQKHPESGRRRPELRNGVRSYAVLPLVVFYSVSDEAVNVLHVVHGSRDLPRLFDEGG